MKVMKPFHLLPWLLPPLPNTTNWFIFIYCLCLGTQALLSLEVRTRALLCSHHSMGCALTKTKTMSAGTVWLLTECNKLNISFLNFDHQTSTVNRGTFLGVVGKHFIHQRSCSFTMLSRKKHNFLKKIKKKYFKKVKNVMDMHSAESICRNISF